MTQKCIELDQASNMLGELVGELSPGVEVVIVKNAKPIAKLVYACGTKQPRKPGLLKGKLTVVSEDDDHLTDFEAYLP